VEIAMTKFQEKAQGQVKQMVGQMIGDDRLVSEGREQLEKAEPKQGVKQAIKQGMTDDRERKRSKHKTPPSKEKTSDPAKR
jgi:uncharacterized protein YjbJ (UPF0337 family)